LFLKVGFKKHKNYVDPKNDKIIKLFLYNKKMFYTNPKKNLQPRKLMH